MDSYAAYLAITGGNTARLVEESGRAQHREHLAALRATDGAKPRWWARLTRPVATARPATA